MRPLRPRGSTKRSSALCESYERFTVVVPEAEVWAIGALAAVTARLRRVDGARLAAMRAEIARVRHLFVWTDDDAADMRTVDATDLRSLSADEARSPDVVSRLRDAADAVIHELAWAPVECDYG